MQTLKCFAIDDEYLALNVINSYVSKIPFLELVGSSKSALQALDILTKEKIDLLFLDIQMPDITGLEFLKSLKNPPFVIFTTAYQEYALSGYDYDIIDYLLKPIRFERFLKAVNKAKEQNDLRNNPPQEQSISPKPIRKKDYFFLKSGYKSVKVFYKEILYVEAQKEYINIYTEEKKFTKIQSLRSILTELPENNFIQIHKSFVVAIDKITAFYGNTIEIEKTSLPIGRSYKADVQQQLSEGNDTNSE